jgi:hypothetical protein
MQDKPNSEIPSPVNAMDRSSFEAANPIIDQMADLIDRTLESAQLAALHQALARLSEALGPRYSVSLNASVEVFDRERSHPLPLLQTGLSTSEGATPYRTWGDSTPHTYITNGQIQVVPHDHCPRCYGTWDFKFRNPTCPDCGATLGKDVKVLLDSDVCPDCEKGTVSMSAPVCSKCGYRVDPRLVTWG